MKKILLLFLIPIFCLAQNTDRKYLSSVWKNNILEIKTSDGTYRIKPYSDKIIETSFLPGTEKFNPDSHAVVMKADKASFKFSETATTIHLKSNTLALRIQKAPFKISYFNKTNEILSEKMGYAKKEGAETLTFNIDATEKLYGGGARVVGMNRRGNRLQLYNRASYGYETRAELMNFCIPLVLSSKIYSVHFDNPVIGYLDLDSKKDNTLSYETISGRKTYQVIVGDTWSDLVSGYTSLTGKQPLIPRWALGNFSSRFGYHTQEEVEKTIRKFEEDKIPVDAIILDLYWFGKTVKGTMGNLDWDKDNFPDPEKMIAGLNQKNIKTILITEPFVLTTSSKWQEAVDKKVLATDASGKPFEYDFYFGHTGIIDVFKPEGKDWFWNVYKRLINQGVGGLWGDLGEPEVFPSEAITFGGKADEVHNIYGHNWAKLVADGYKKEFPSVRPFILMRAGYSGSQRFGMIPWSGDVSRGWGGLQAQPEIALQMGMQGMAYMHSDLGGFAGDYFDNELYIRWLQYGVFQPIFRPHAQEDVASEPVYKDIVTKAKAKKQVELRYQMLPYNYTLAFENNLNGAPLMRPLFFEEPENENLATVSDTYLWGNDFLVKPITAPNVTSTPVYFPKNNNWFDFYTDKKYTAGSLQDINVTEEHIPVFVRSGAFIPLIATIQNTSQYTLTTFDLHFYFDEAVNKSSGQLYNDDGVTPDNYENKKYEKITFQSKTSTSSVVLKIDSNKQNLAANTKKVNLIVHGLSKNPAKITINGKSIVASDWTFSNNLVTLSITIVSGASQEIEITL